MTLTRCLPVSNDDRNYDKDDDRDDGNDHDPKDDHDDTVDTFSAPLWVAQKRISRTTGSVLLWCRSQQGHVSTSVVAN